MKVEGVPTGNYLKTQRWQHSLAQVPLLYLVCSFPEEIALLRKERPSWIVAYIK